MGRTVAERYVCELAPLPANLAASERDLNRADRSGTGIPTAFTNELTCGMDSSSGRIACGIEMFKDPRKGARFLIPLYQEPAAEGPQGPSAEGQGDIDRLTQMEVTASLRLREAALGLLARFLGERRQPRGYSAPAQKTGMLYPVMGRDVAGRYQITLDRALEHPLPAEGSGLSQPGVPSKSAFLGVQPRRQPDVGAYVPPGTPAHTPQLQPDLGAYGPPGSLALPSVPGLHFL